MQKQISFQMLMELNGLSFMYEDTIADCFYSVCYKLKVPEEVQQSIKQECINDVKKALLRM